MLLVRAFADPLWSWQGVRNLSFHLREGNGALGAFGPAGVLAVLSPWIVLPVVTALGLRRHRRWGWFLGIASCVLYVPTPLVAFSVHGLCVLLSGRVRRM